ncbi:hypothetical protein NDU88_004316 [Pleurodeles waltl]|uniref:Uncharacterized protein n=1 Tax=Pleurodeles waltl TaxID=8319 RepID=A0AAV7NJ79_PLEWA|nr:hypothetical protein NDU88_004316 [Pleurodeles waltl]
MRGKNRSPGLGFRPCRSSEDGTRPEKAGAAPHAAPLAGGGSRPPSGNRQKTAPRSKDRSGHSGFPTGLAGDRQKAARQPSGKHPSTMKPAPNGAGGVEGVRRVQ